jgi:hypothetical protein
MPEAGGRFAGRLQYQVDAVGPAGPRGGTDERRVAGLEPVVVA